MLASSGTVRKWGALLSCAWKERPNDVDDQRSPYFTCVCAKPLTSGNVFWQSNACTGGMPIKFYKRTVRRSRFAAVHSQASYEPANSACHLSACLLACLLQVCDVKTDFGHFLGWVRNTSPPSCVTSDAMSGTYSVLCCKRPLQRRAL